jgi:predicted  nucleic acid-binding Zn-ribbon protein
MAKQQTKGTSMQQEIKNLQDAAAQAGERLTKLEKRLTELEEKVREHEARRNHRRDPVEVAAPVRHGP